jgi:hypothetical protein
MTRKIRCIHIDGIDKAGKTSITREVRKYLKNKNLDLHEINGTDDNKLKLQSVLLEDNHNSVILKENSVLSLLQDDIKKGISVISLGDNYRELLRKEQDINHTYGSVHFFLIPESMTIPAERFRELSDFSGILDSYNFFKNINNYAISQGLDINLVYFDENDKIMDIRDKILAIIEKNYKI